MYRNLDMTALRSFVAVAEEGGVTRAARFLNLTQSAVSMQLKRLEESLDTTLLDRSARTIALTAQGEQLLGSARRMLALNDEIYGKMTGNVYEGTLTLGVPHDIVYPAIPPVLQRFASAFPRVQVQLLSSYTAALKQEFASGNADIILTTEDDQTTTGEELSARRLVWIGAPDGQVYKQRPLPLAFEHRCAFRNMVQERLSAGGVSWDMAVESDSFRTIEATVSADLAVHALIEGTVPAHCTVLQADCGLPELGQTRINMYHNRQSHSPVMDEMLQMLRLAFGRHASRNAPL